MKANGAEVARWQVGGPSTQRARIPAEVASRSRVLRLDFAAAEVHSPAEVGMGGDTRELGVAFLRARLTLAR